MTNLKDFVVIRFASENKTFNLLILEYICNKFVLQQEGRMENTKREPITKSNPKIFTLHNNNRN